MRNRRSEHAWDETAGGTIAFLAVMALTLGATLGMVATLMSEGW